MIPKFKISILLGLIFCICQMTGFSQEILDEMKLEDISDTPEIRGMILRNPKEALLIVKSQIPTLRVDSNNEIFRTEIVEEGKMHVYLAPGTHRLSFQAKGFLSIRKRFFFEPKMVKGVIMRVISSAEVRELKNSSVLVIKSEPEDAQVYLNNEYYGSTPYLGRILSGRYQLILKKDNYREHEEAIILVPGEVVPMNVKLIAVGDTSGDSLTVSPKQFFTLNITSTPSASITINNNLAGQSPLNRRYTEGTILNIRLTQKDYLDWEKTITITGDDSIHVDLTQKKSGSKKWLFIAGGAVLAGAAVLVAGGGGDSGPPSTQGNILKEPPAWPGGN